jgi:hypothetical protein
MVNPDEMHDGTPLDGNLRGWRMLYLDPILVAREVEEEIVGTAEIVRPVVHDPLLSMHFSRLFACLTASQPNCLANEEILLPSLIYIVRQHGVPRPLSSGVSPCVARAIQRLDSAPNASVSLGVWGERFQLLRGFAREKELRPMPISFRGACALHGSFWLRV